MIYVSSSSVRSKDLFDSVKRLNNHGFFNIELSGSYNYSKNTELLLTSLYQKNDKIEFRCHNYLNLLENDFVLNLASNDSHLLKLSETLIHKSIDLTASFKQRKYSVHAGLCLNLTPSDLGVVQSEYSIIPYEKAFEQFKNNFLKLFEYAQERGISLYFENNVLSQQTLKKFNGVIPFLMLISKEIIPFIEKYNLNFLLDIAHLKVTCNTLGIDYEKELYALLDYSDYLHISDNNGISDQHFPLFQDSELYKLLANKGIKNKDITLEVCSDIDHIQSTYDGLLKLL